MRKGSDGVIVLLNKIEEVVVYFTVGFDNLCIMASVGPHAERRGV